MAEEGIPSIREEILARRWRLEQAYQTTRGDAQIERLLQEVDLALSRLDNDTYGLCEVCYEPIERDRLLADPLVRFCLDHLSPAQRQLLEDDLELAKQIQAELLPPQGMTAAGWDTAYHYEGAGLVSGDYCDLLEFGGHLYFVVGDVSGKGVSAALLMTHLHATFRALVSQDLAIDVIMERASRIFCESTLPTYFATLVCGKATVSGEIELSIAGHQPAIVTHGSDVMTIEATGLPLGMFCDERFTVSRTRLAEGDSLLLYTDGLTEAVDSTGEEYGTRRATDILERNRSRPAGRIIAACLEDLQDFRSGTPRNDDLTIMVVQRRRENR
jgi:sigma-B regulation protein RsbU (phosphoserine phosphatase)